MRIRPASALLYRKPRLFGRERRADMQRVNAAVPYLNRLKGEIAQALSISGAIMDASILTQLIINSERLAARQKM